MRLNLGKTCIFMLLWASLYKAPIYHFLIGHDDYYVSPTKILLIIHQFNHQPHLPTIKKKTSKEKKKQKPGRHPSLTPKFLDRYQSNRQ